MPEASQITYTLKELTALMLRDQGVQEGLWMIWARFNFQATNFMSDSDGGPSGPGVISMLSELGIQKAKEESPLSVDAASIWEDDVEVRRKKAPKTQRKARASR